MPVHFVKKIDNILRLFDGDLSLSEIISMDYPSQRAMVFARIENLKKSQEAFEQGKIDSYSRRYASSMGGLSSIGSSTSISSTSPQSQYKSKNARIKN